MNPFKRSKPADVNAFMNGYNPEDVPPEKEVFILPENAHLIPPERPAPPPPQKVKPSCRHKYEVLEYPDPGRQSYIFYCQYCLDMKEKKPPGAG